VPCFLRLLSGETTYIHMLGPSLGGVFTVLLPVPFCIRRSTPSRTQRFNHDVFKGRPNQFAVGSKGRQDPEIRSSRADGNAGDLGGGGTEETVSKEQ
jgi:hypothetical protein